MVEEKKKYGLWHNFFLLNSKLYLSNQEIDLDEIFEKDKCVNICDDHLNYLSDTLSWIPVNKLYNNDKYLGLNFYGDTIIAKDASIIAKEIFKSWANLFRCGMENFELTGSYSWEINKPDQGFYKKIPTNRDDFVEKLETLVFYCDEVIKSNNQKFIWHFGI